MFLENYRRLGGGSREHILFSLVTLQMKKVTLRNSVNGLLGVGPVLSVFAKMLHRMNSLV